MSFASPSRPDAIDDDALSQTGSDEDGEADAGPVSHEEYSARMEELLDSGSEGSEDGFIYDGIDAPKLDYREQLRDALSDDGDDDDAEVEDEKDELRVEQMVGHANGNGVPPPLIVAQADDDDELASNQGSEPALSTRVLMSPRPYLDDDHERADSPASRPAFLHPTISRLRSFAPRYAGGGRMPSGSTVHSFSSPFAHDTMSPQPSHFSAISRTSSWAEAAPQGTSTPHNEAADDAAHRPFRWTPLREIGHHIYLSRSHKASELLGMHGTATVLAANGLVCVGTNRGKTFVFDFKQQLRCICGTDAIAKAAGAVTALSLSNDHTFVAVGHETGHIYLYDLARHQTPARTVLPTTLAAVSTGRKEGHIAGSRIIALGFVGARHTAIMSADDQGLAFYHSLGQVLFVEAADTLRILGKYPAPKEKPRRNGSSSILAAEVLPLGPAPHPVDTYQVIALLTPSKLVLVGLKPQPRTWHRVHRDEEPNMRGCLAWFPSTNVHDGHGTNPNANGNGKANGKTPPSAGATKPMLVFSWGRTFHLVRVREEKLPPRPGTKEPQGTLVFESGGKWRTDADILALQWLNVQQLAAVTTSSIEVYDMKTLQRVERTPFRPQTLIQDAGLFAQAEDDVFSDASLDIARSVKSYKGKLFLLGRKELQVGSLLSWADRILAYVRDGDFLAAVDLCRAYYTGEATGNKLGLPEDPAALRELVGKRLYELMTASAHYAFSEDRMRDGTHMAPDGRGVDRTSLFEDLVATCARACMALDEYDFLFQDLFELYQNHLITPIFLVQIEPFVLDGRIKAVPPMVTQQLIAYHEAREDLEKAERVIWHIDPQCLDINQAITLCERHQLYDALIYVYTRSLRDYMSPLVELLGLVRKVQRYRKERSLSHLDDDAVERLTLNAYKIFTYLANVLSGLTYPSQEPIPEEEAVQARKDFYTFLFFGRSSVWPAGDGGRLILTMDDESIPEPTYPYLRLLLRFDSEAFLHALDIAFEDSYLNDDSRGIGRLIILKILLEVLTSPTVPPLSSTDETFVYIFIARNVPKYPQFIELPPSSLHSVLIGLANDPDPTTREDRQLAAECLLSSYTPHDSDHIMGLFDQAGFFRILRSWHRRDRHWPDLISTYLRDPDVEAPEMFVAVDEVLATAARPLKGQLPDELVVCIMDALDQFLEYGLVQTAALVDRHMPRLHARVLETIQHPARQFAYLRSLLQPGLADQDTYDAPLRSLAGTPSTKLDAESRHLYLSLMCTYDPSGIIEAMEDLPPDTFDLARVVAICEEHEVYGAVVWVRDRQGDVDGALDKIEEIGKMLATRLAEDLQDDGSKAAQIDLRGVTDNLQNVARVAVSICRRHSDLQDVPVEDVWLHVLRSQLDTVQIVSSSLALNVDPTDDMGDQDHSMLAFMRTLVQDTFSELLSHSRSKVSLSRLFKRLVDSSSAARSASKTVYTEFKRILTTTLETYKADGDSLEITNRLLERDIFEVVEDLTAQRQRGWTAKFDTCGRCRKSIQSTASVLPPAATPSARGKGKQPATNDADDSETASDNQLVILRTGIIYHSHCYAALTPIPSPILSPVPS